MRPYILNWIKKQGGSPAPSEYNAKMRTDNGAVIGSLYADTPIKLIIEMPVIDTSKYRYFNIQSFFEDMLSLISIPPLDTTGQKNFYHLAQNCRSLVNVPILNTESATELSQAFANCIKLSNESLNNIMQMCINTTSAYTKTKTLRYLGLTQAQATTCQSLSNWDAFVAAGWTTGY